MTQQSAQPYYKEDCKDRPRWNFMFGKLFHTNSSRTTISQSLLENPQQIAIRQNTQVNYLIESALHKLLRKNEILIHKEFKSTDRIPYKTTYDQKLLIDVRLFAKENKLYVNDVTEYSIRFLLYKF